MPSRLPVLFLLLAAAAMLTGPLLLTPRVATAADGEAEIGTWTCVHKLQGACPPDGQGRGAEDFWTYPPFYEKIAVSCWFEKGAWETCAGTYRYRRQLHTGAVWGGDSHLSGGLLSDLWPVR